ncbi:uncharacterized protein [Miscanthus floridulus]|uniref:uncharacterized protein isoform X4 n=1 Tax=Miscanthus floridulus TaxID=154761 RepID=UPI00345A5956
MRGLPLTESVARSSSAIARGDGRIEAGAWSPYGVCKFHNPYARDITEVLPYGYLSESYTSMSNRATLQVTTLQFGAFYNMQYVKMVAGYSSSTKFQMHVLIVQLKSRLSRSQKVISSRRCGPMIVPASSPIPNPNAKGALSTESVSFTC